MPEKRTIFIGDVHGCAEELRDLLALLRPHPGRDEVIFIGDLVNKGPDSAGVWREFRRLGARSLVGNHERALLEMASGRWKRGTLLEDMESEFGRDFDEFLRDIASWPYWLETTETIAVHAGFFPDRPVSETPDEDLCTLRLWRGEGAPPDQDRPWFESYHGPKMAVFGHWAALGGVVRPNAIGLDTGCVYGGRLTALEWPSRRLVSVPARRVYEAIRTPGF